MLDTKERAIVLLSGGIDSAVCLWQARERRLELYTISFDYYRRRKREIVASENLSRAARSKDHMKVQLQFLRELEDTITDKRSQLHDRRPDIPRSYIPLRNMIFYSIAASWGELIGARRIIGGHNREDLSSFPDASPAFFDPLNRAIALGSRVPKGRRMRIVTPLIRYDKVKVISEAIRLRVPLDLTWSCQRRDDSPCGECPSCVSRNRAFSSLGMRDPLG